MRVRWKVQTFGEYFRVSREWRWSRVGVEKVIARILWKSWKIFYRQGIMYSILIARDLKRLFLYNTEITNQLTLLPNHLSSQELSTKFPWSTFISQASAISFDTLIPLIQYSQKFSHETIALLWISFNRDWAKIIHEKYSSYNIPRKLTYHKSTKSVVQISGVCVQTDGQPEAWARNFLPAWCEQKELATV